MKDINKIIVRESSTIKEAMRVIDIGTIKMAVVVNEKKQLSGIVTDGDIRRGIINGIDINEPVFLTMNKNPIYIHEEVAKKDIIEVMKKNSIIGLPIVDENLLLKDFVLMWPGEGLTFFTKHPEIRKIENILVIGGAGYIGSILVRKLLKRGYKATILDKFIYGKDSIKEIENEKNLTIIEGDTRHIEDITRAIKNVDSVVHLAEIVGGPCMHIKPAINTRNKPSCHKNCCFNLQAFPD